MNKDRKVLLIILYVTLILSISLINIFVKNEQWSDLTNRIKLSEQKFEKQNKGTHEVSIVDVQKYSELIEEEKKRYFYREDTDPYKFGIEIKNLLENQALIVISYKTIEMVDSYLIEFTVEGNSSFFFSFLKKLYDNNKNYTFPYFMLKNTKHGISSKFRIGYVLYE
ncbi:MAG: hypothetical protein PF518_10885 [Spirochaetaceae bacterium]|jgi:hypothetical protein|nr:hypothetical protein [Spirochaetaceae bacterium]